MNIQPRFNMTYIWQRLLLMVTIFTLLPALNAAYAMDSLCAEVKIVIEQKLSLERQAFDAKMVVSNGLTESDLQDVKIELIFLDSNEWPVIATQDPNATEAKFFYRTDSIKGINAIDGSGTVAKKSSAEIHWLIIPATGSSKGSGTIYYVGAKVTYTLNGETTSVEVTPDFIVVKPLPTLTLDYFLPADVYADDPFTAETEPAVPFTLGVRITNSGEGASSQTVIESAQPKIVENDQGLAIGFEILGGYISDLVAGKSLLLDFGEIAPHSAKVGRWSMVTTLSGKFVEFNATYSHADNLGGAVTSLIDKVNTHTLVHDVKVNISGRDNIRDFLAYDNDVLRVYESDGIDTEVTNQSADAQLSVSNGQAKITFDAAPGFVYLQLTDPYQGTKPPVDVQRSDGKRVPIENVWLSKTHNDDLTWSYYINIFDVNSTGSYSFVFAQDVKASLSGLVYEDANGDGLLNANESGVAVVAVTLRGVADSGANVIAVAHTDASGVFAFKDLSPGRYSLEVAAVNGMSNGSTLAGDAGGITEPGKITEIVLSAGSNSQGNFFAKRSGTAEVVSGHADLLVAAIASSNLTPSVGDLVTLSIMVGNAGAESAKNVAMSFALPDNLSLLSSNASIGQYKAGQWSLGDVKPYGVGLLQLVVKVNSLNGNIPLTARIGSQTADTDLNNNTATVILLAGTSHE